MIMRNIGVGMIEEDSRKLLSGHVCIQLRDSLPRGDGGDLQRWVCSAAILKFALCSFPLDRGATVRMHERGSGRYGNSSLSLYAAVGSCQASVEESTTER